MRTLDEPESPDVSPDGKRVVFSAIQGGTATSSCSTSPTREITNLTKDAFADAGPTWSPDGRSIVYMARISGNEKLFRLDVDTRQEDAAHLRHARRRGGAVPRRRHAGLLRPRPPIPPQPIDPDVARNGKIYNIWTLSLKNGELRQFTDTIGGNTSAVVLPRGSPGPQMAFIGYYKGDYELHALEQPRPDHHRGLVRLRLAGRHHRLPGAAGPHADRRQDQAQGQVREDVRGRPAAGERRRDERRRPVRRLGGDVQRRARRPAVQHVRGVGVAVPHVLAVVSEPRAPLQLRAPGLLADAVLLRPAARACSTTRPSPASSTATSRWPRRTVRGGTAFGIWPFNRYRRVELFGGVMQYQENFNDPGLDAESQRVPAGAVRAADPALRHLRAVRRQLRAGNDGLPRVRAAVRQHRAACATRSRRRSATPCRARPPTWTRGSTSASAARGCWRCGPAASAAGATRRTSCISAATPRCVATTTCRSWAARRRSSTRSCGSR